MTTTSDTPTATNGSDVPPAGDPMEASIVDLLASASKLIGPIARSDYNSDQGFAYRGIDAILRQVQPTFAELGIVVTSTITDRWVEHLQTRSGSTWRLVTLKVRWSFLGPRGDKVTSTTVGEGYDPSDKAATKAFTAAYKQVLSKVLAIADGETEADKENGPEASSIQPRRAESRRREHRNSSSRAPAPPPEVDRLSAIVSAHGQETADKVAWIIEQLNAIPDGPRRKHVKDGFVEEHGSPFDLNPETVEGAVTWIMTAIPPPPTS